MGVISFVIDKIPSHTVATFLDRRSICVRSGLHCAPLIHKALGTEQTGAVRISVSYLNETADIDRLYLSLADFLKIHV